jgi:hypothetical protein
MNLSEMIAIVRKDLHDEDSENYRWSDAELTRHINRAVKELSDKIPLPTRATLPTNMGSRELDISGVSNRIMVEAVEYPVDASPPGYQRFSIWGDTITIISGSEPDGSNCYRDGSLRHQQGQRRRDINPRRIPALGKRAARILPGKTQEIGQGAESAQPAALRVHGLMSVSGIQKWKRGLSLSKLSSGPSLSSGDLSSTAFVSSPGLKCLFCSPV